MTGLQCERPLLAKKLATRPTRDVSFFKNKLWFLNFEDRFCFRISPCFASLDVDRKRFPLLSPYNSEQDETFSKVLLYLFPWNSSDRYFQDKLENNKFGSKFSLERSRIFKKIFRSTFLYDISKFTLVSLDPSGAPIKNLVVSHTSSKTTRILIFHIYLHKIFSSLLKRTRLLHSLLLTVIASQLRKVYCAYREISFFPCTEERNPRTSLI